MRIEATIGPVTLLVERDLVPRAGDRFRVAVFIADRALGPVTLTYEQWMAFCQGDGRTVTCNPDTRSPL